MKAKELLGLEKEAPSKRGRKKKAHMLSQSWCKKVAELPTLKLVRMREATTTVIVNEYPLEADKPKDKRDPEYIELACKLAYITKVVESRLKQLHIKESQGLRDVYRAEYCSVTAAFEALTTEFRFGNVLCDHANALDKVRDLIATASMLAYKMGGE